MKLQNYFFLIFFGILAFFAQAQNTTENTTEVEVNSPVDFYITQPMRDYPQFNPEDFPPIEIPRGGMLSGSRQQKADFLKLASESPTQIDPLIQTNVQTRNSNPPIENFPGLTSTQYYPPDPTAAVGPNHIVQMINLHWSVWDKSGNQAPGFPKSLSNPLGSIDGDPIVLYDREADRWLISAFVFGSSFKVAVSNTSDPTGTYTVYVFSSGFNDYPKFGIYGNSYIITGNFTPNGRFYALNREKMITGDPTAEIANLTLPSYIWSGFFQAPQPAHSEGAGIATGPAPIVWFQDDAWGVSTDHVKVWNLDIDWANPGGATVSAPLEIELAPFDSFIAGTGGDAFANLQQPNTSQRIDALVHAINYQTHRYDFGTHESIVLNFVIETINGSKISGLRWAELRKSGGGDWELYQEGTYVDPVGDESVFMGGIGMDQNGNIGMGYIKTGATTRPSLFYTGRLDGSTLGVMNVAEELIINGTTSLTNSSRYGDYCQLTRDPVDDLTFWFTGQYSGQAGGLKTRIASFKIDGVLNVDELDLNSSELFITSSDHTNFEITLFNESTNDILRLSVYDISGKRVVYNQVKKENSQFYKHALDMSNVSSGLYIVEIGNSKTKLTKKIIVN